MFDKFIVFDIGNVIFKFDLLKFVKSFIKKTPNYKKDIFNFESWITPPCLKLAYLYEKGNISSLDFYNKLSRQTQYSGTFNEFKLSWNNIFEPIPETIDIIASLANKYKLAILSNTNELHFNFLQERYPQVFSLFEQKFLSHKINLRKPDQKIYRYLIKGCNVPPSEIFFTDDLPENISAAKESGIKAYVYTSTQDLIKQLQAEEILML